MANHRSVILIGAVTAAASIVAAASTAQTTTAPPAPAVASALPAGGLAEQLQTLTEQVAALREALKGLQPRRFYLTKELFTGGQTLNACAAGFHMASLLEIREPSHFKYDTALGYQSGDSGDGPPTAALGWIRSATDNGTFNCQFWTSSGLETGTSAELVRFSNWFEPATHISPWLTRIGSTDTLRCDAAKRVWCVEDR